MRMFPNMVVMAPGDAEDLRQMLAWALTHNGPASIRYPKANAETIDGVREPIALGRAEVLRPGRAGTIIACGTLLTECIKAAQILANEGLDFGVINARFVKPLDTETLLKAVSQTPVVVTVEEATLMGGFGSAALEMCGEAGVSAAHVHRLGVPDRFVEHADRGELLSILGLDAAGVARTCRRLATTVSLQQDAV
jgi:1-deoxy-D-xylulose-5-phosphate synthase